MQIHKFESSGDAYDACQCDDGIKDGDVLVIESEGVVGVADTWPFAVTVAHGELHTIKAGISPEQVAENQGKPALCTGWYDALKVAQEMGLKVRQ